MVAVVKPTLKPKAKSVAVHQNFPNDFQQMEPKVVNVASLVFHILGTSSVIVILLQNLKKVDFCNCFVNIIAK